MENWIIGQDKPEKVLKFIYDQADSTKKAPIICFDYFDTLVTRCVEPEYTKQIASGLLSRLLQGCFTGESIYHFRKDIEYDLCLACAEASNELEFCFEDLGRNLWAELKKQDVRNVLPVRDRFIKEMLAIEVAVEKAVQSVCAEVFEVIQTLHRLDFTLLLISDFYLPEKQFLEILSWHRLEHLFAKVYISSVHGRSKGSGRIYPMICENLGVEFGQLLMIGDNPHADIKMSRQHGLQAIHLQRPDGKNMAGTRKKKEKDNSADPKQPFEKMALPEEVPFPEIGIDFWIFTHRLFEELNEHDVRNVFFLSKEGEFLKKIFDQYQLSLFGSLKIKSHYLLASRKATFIASLRSIDEEDFSRLLDHYRDISIRDFLQSLNLDNGIIDAICKKMAHDCDLRLSDIRHHHIFQELLALDIFHAAFEAKRLEQKIYFFRYLESFKVDYRGEGLHLVDVGWKGSIQDNIYLILSAEVTVKGYYIGSFNATERSVGNCKKGLLFDNYPRSSPFFNVFNSNRSLFEMILGASHGSARSYRSADTLPTSDGLPGDIRVETGPGVYHPLVVTDEIPEERQLFERHIKPLQQKIVALNSEMNRAYMVSQRIPSEEWFARHHARMVFRPTIAEIEWFESLYHYENFGVFEVTNFETSHNFSLFERLRNLKNIVTDPAVLESGVWPPIILRRFGVGFWQPIDGLRRYYREFGTFC